MSLVDDIYKTIEPYMTIGKIYEFRAVILPPGEGFVIHFGDKIYFTPQSAIACQASITEVAPEWEGGFVPTGNPIAVKI